MNIPNIHNALPYIGLYVVDFGDHSCTGFTAEEVAELVDSEKYANIKIYKIHNAYPDGRMELVGVRNDLFGLETGLFFYAADSATAQSDYKRLVDLAVRLTPPARAKVQRARYADGQFVTALIYPAEYDDQFSRWLSEGNYRTAGTAEGGIEACQRYLTQAPEVLSRHQLWGGSALESLTGQKLLEATNRAIVR
jgi:hypothetical protein